MLRRARRLQLGEHYLDKDEVMGNDLYLASAAAAASLVCFACSSQVTYLGNASSSSSTTSSSTSSSSTSGGTTSSGTGGSGATGGGPVGGSGGDSGECVNTHEQLLMTLETPDGDIYSCQASNKTKTGLVQIQGEVIGADDSGVVIDTCPPNAFCEPSVFKLSYSAPDLKATVPLGVFVDVSVRVDMPWGCSHELKIVNLPQWEGLTNPIPVEHLWVAAADGTYGTLPDSPFKIGLIELPCWGPEEWSKSYSLHFETLDATPPVTVAMGSTVEWIWNSGHYMTVRNLRSFETGYDDDDWNWGWWLTGDFITPD